MSFYNLLLRHKILSALALVGLCMSSRPTRSGAARSARSRSP
ncbi:hypothetical protein [Methylocella sp.]